MGRGCCRAAVAPSRLWRAGPGGAAGCLTETKAGFAWGGEGAVEGPTGALSAASAWQCLPPSRGLSLKLR